MKLLWLLVELRIHAGAVIWLEPYHPSRKLHLLYLDG